MSTPIITIDESYWENASYYQKEQLIFHELGHCILKKNHDDSYLNSYPRSIMHSYQIPSNIYEDRLEYYYEELFTN